MDTQLLSVAKDNDPLKRMIMLEDLPRIACTLEADG